MHCYFEWNGTHETSTTRWSVLDFQVFIFNFVGNFVEISVIKTQPVFIFSWNSYRIFSNLKTKKVKTALHTQIKMSQNFNCLKFDTTHVYKFVWFWIYFYQLFLNFINRAWQNDGIYGDDSNEWSHRLTHISSWRCWLLAHLSFI